MNFNLVALLLSLCFLNIFVECAIIGRVTCPQSGTSSEGLPENYGTFTIPVADPVDAVDAVVADELEAGVPVSEEPAQIIQITQTNCYLFHPQLLCQLICLALLFYFSQFIFAHVFIVFISLTTIVACCCIACSCVR